MMSVCASTHAIARMAQRGIRLSDVDLALEIGTAVADGVLIRERDYQEIERATKEFLRRVRALKGKRLVVAGDTIVTAYHASRAEERRLLRH